MTGTAWNSTLRPGGPLKRTKGLAARTGLARTAGLTTRTPIPPVSVKRAAENRERRRLKEQLWPDGERPRCARPGCPRLADDIHEILPRARSGGVITDPSIWAPLCRQDNDEATLEPGWAYEAGLLFHSWDAPGGGEAA